MKANSNGAVCQTWTDLVNRGELYVPSDQFFSQLTAMREIFKAIHKEGLREGKGCLKTLVSEMKCGVTDVPDDVIRFFCKNLRIF